jgi:hypothetical protein
VGQPVGLARQLLGLPFLRIGGDQLVPLEFQQGPLSAPRLGRVEQVLSLAAQRLMRLPRRPVGRQPVAQAAIGVQQVPLLVRVHQGAALMLAVNVHQALAQLLQCGDRHRQGIHRRAPAPLCRDPARDDQLLVIQHALASKDGLELGPKPGVRDFEDRGRARLGLAGADQLGRRLLAQDQAQCGQEQALPCTRLARPGAESRLQLDVHIFDQRQVLHREFTQHGRLPD